MRNDNPISRVGENIPASALYSDDLRNSNIRHATSTPIKVGLFIVFLFFGVFVSWASFAPLTGAVVARGSVVTSSKKQTVQHAEGGIIDKVFVRDGKKVKKDQALIKLVDIDYLARQEALNNQLYSLLANKSRLVAEKEMSNEIDFSELDLVIWDHKDEIISNQEKMLFHRRNYMTAQLDILSKRIFGIENEISGLISQLTASNSQRELLEEELSDAESLFSKGFDNKNKSFSLRKQIAELNGRIGQYTNSIGKAEQRISEVKLESESIKSKFYSDIERELKDVTVSITDIKEKIKSNSDLINRSTIRSPRSGIVTDMRYTTNGGVIRPGASILDVVPLENNLTVDVYISPENISSLLSLGVDLANYGDKNHLPSDEDLINVRVRFLTKGARSIPMINGYLNRISADSTLDERRGFSYYTANIIIPDSEVAKLGVFKLYPGMPAEALITTKKYTFLSYLLKPLYISASKAALDS
ncbi:MAG: HlyD family type I secretion periplasmic adaptor subunit [Gammaproteobacteria bacterium]|nr:HlyD family type I secretion periplasmic adaptor subunit [Gammaproteobacteria bacterium]